MKFMLQDVIFTSDVLLSFVAFDLLLDVATICLDLIEFCIYVSAWHVLHLMVISYPYLAYVVLLICST